MLGTSSARTMHGESRCTEKARPDEYFSDSFRSLLARSIEDTIGSRSNRGAFDSTFLFLRVSKEMVKNRGSKSRLGRKRYIRDEILILIRQRTWINIYDPVGTVNCFDFESLENGKWLTTKPVPP